jgi:type II secretory pathway predicted ATPase ExeA
MKAKAYRVENTVNVEVEVALAEGAFVGMTCYATGPRVVLFDLVVEDAQALKDAGDEALKLLGGQQ